jgi:hypothetical protein
MYFSSMSDGSYCYALGGIAHDNTLTILDDAIRYDPDSGAWEAIDDLPQPVAFSDGDFLNGNLFIAGGGAGTGRWPASDRVWCWAEGIGWLEATPLPEPVGCPHVELATIDGTHYIFVFGGYNDGYLETLYIGEILNLPTSIDPDQGATPSRYMLFQSEPNPFNPNTLIQYALPHDTWVRLHVYDIVGREIATLIDGMQTAGFHSVRWTADSFSSGAYFYRLETKDFGETRKMVGVK